MIPKLLIGFGFIHLKCVRIGLFLVNSFEYVDLFTLDVPMMVFEYCVVLKILLLKSERL